MKKFITILLFLTFGFIGAHRFYLGFMKSGFLYFIFWVLFFTSIILKHENIGVLIIILIILYWIHDLLFFAFKFNYQNQKIKKSEDDRVKSIKLDSVEENVPDQEVKIVQVDDNTLKIGNVEISQKTIVSSVEKNNDLNLIDTEYFQRSLNFSKSILIKSKKIEIDSLIFLCGVFILDKDVQNNFFDKNILTIVNTLADQEQIITNGISEYSGSQKFKLNSSFQEILKQSMKQDFQNFLELLKISVLKNYNSRVLEEDSLDVIIRDYQKSCMQAYKQLSTNFTLNEPTISDEDFKFLSSIYQLEEDDSRLLSNKIRFSKIIPRFMPKNLTNRFDEIENSEVFQKGWWMSPLSAIGFQYYSPLLLNQNGIYALTKFGSKKFELICSFKIFQNHIFSDRNIFDLSEEIHENGVISQSDENIKNQWNTIYLYNETEENLKNFNIYSEKSYDFLNLNNILVFSAMLDVWTPVLQASRNFSEYYYPDDIFRDFYSMEEIVEWARSEMTADEIEHINHFNEKINILIEKTKVRLGSKITDNYYFLNALKFAKSISIKSQRTEIDKLIFLCGAFLSNKSENYIEFTRSNIEFLRQKAMENDLSLDVKNGYDGELKFSLEKSFHNLLKKHVRSDFAELISDVLKNIKQQDSN